MALSESKFNMWRTVVSMSHADEVLHASEEDFLAKFFDSLNDISNDQIEVLKKDLETAQSPKDMYEKISEPKDRAELFYYARMLMWADGDFCSNEEDVFNKLKEITLSKIDFDKVMTEVRQIAKDYEMKHEAQKDARPLHRKVIDAIIFWEDLP